jgi:5,10-methylenetetrahydromethanopterin reductase
LLAALGPRTIEFGGRVMDGVVLHTFFADDTLARCVALVRRGAERAGRDPSSVRVWSVLAVMCDMPEETRLKYLVGRMATYLQAYGDALIGINGWDPAVLARFRADETVRSMLGPIDAIATREQLAYIETLIPAEWLAASAVGDASHCAKRIQDQLDAGANGVILHASTPIQLAPVLEAYANR